MVWIDILSQDALSDNFVFKFSEKMNCAGSDVQFLLLRVCSVFVEIYVQNYVIFTDDQNATICLKVKGNMRHKMRVRDDVTYFLDQLTSARLRAWSIVSENNGK